MNISQPFNRSTFRNFPTCRISLQFRQRTTIASTAGWCYGGALSETITPKLGILIPSRFATKRRHRDVTRCQGAEATTVVPFLSQEEVLMFAALPLLASGMAELMVTETLATWHSKGVHFFTFTHCCAWCFVTSPSSSSSSQQWHLRDKIIWKLFQQEFASELLRGIM